MSDLYIEKKFYKITHFKINARLTYDILSKCLIYSVYRKQDIIIIVKINFKRYDRKDIDNSENIFVRKGVSLSKEDSINIC
ncbi:hypothetical protein DBR28_20370 [Chryseobacterium sp. HMWF028]|nr:hypothetical protein DBR28_20370 [Chryseobacterium sp. HMWF028]